MSVPSEPEKYSIDDMMDRLKNRPDDEPIEDGRLVTRSDGSQAIRVRKKKRRSQQPQKEERRLQRRARMIQVSGALILIMAALLAAGLSIVYANSSQFRNALAGKIATSTGADVEMQMFRMNPTSANAGGLTLTWPEGNVLHDLKLRGVRARVSPMSFLGKAMTGEEVNFAEGTLTLRTPQDGQPTRKSPATGGAPTIRFDSYNVPKFHLIIGDPAAPSIRMWDSEATFVQNNPDTRPQLLLSRGTINIAGWPKIRLDRSHIEFREAEVDIVGMRLKHESDNRGVLELSGTVSPYSADRASTLAVRLETYLISGIAGPELGRLFSGRIDTAPSTTSNYLSFTPGADSSSSLSVTFRGALASPLELTGFPFLFGLSQTLNDEWFSRPIFDTEINGAIRRADGNVLIEEIDFQNKGRMALKGAVKLTPDQQLSGKLEVGVAEGMLKTAENRRLDAIFSPSQDGFRWLTLTIAGTHAAPTDNFKQIYDSSAAPTGNSKSREIPSFEDLTRPK